MTDNTTTHRAGLAFPPTGTNHAVDLSERAEAAGVETAWMIMRATGLDTPTLFAAAAMRTERIRLGTAIVPAFTRHPLALATQALAIEELAPGRLRLGIGPSHARTMEAVYHLPFDRPLAQLREYLQVLRPALHDGQVSFAGEFYRVDVEFAAAPKTPMLISALREGSFELAGELSDGAISWLCPVEYLLERAKPALARGAERAGRERPPLIAHALVAIQTDRDAVRTTAREQLAYYAAAPFYARMFAAAGYPLGPGNAIGDDLIDALVVSGDEDAIVAQLRERLDRGLDELLVSLILGPDWRADEDALLRILGRV